MYLFNYLFGCARDQDLRSLLQHAGALVVAGELLVVAYVGSSSLTKDGTQSPCIGTEESQPLDHQGNFHTQTFHKGSESLLLQSSVNFYYWKQQNQELTQGNLWVLSMFHLEISNLFFPSEPGSTSLANTKLYPSSFPIPVFGLLSRVMRSSKLPSYSFTLGFLGGSVVKNLLASAGDVGLNPGSKRSPGEGNGNPLQYSCLGNPMDRGPWHVTVHGAAKESDTTQ